MLPLSKSLGVFTALPKLVSSRPTVTLFNHIRSFLTCVNPLLFRVTTCLYAEPLKKKKKLDPAVIKQREERKRKKIEKQIRRLERNARQLKPIDEIEVPLKLIDEKSIRTRVLPPASEDINQPLLEKAWAHYKSKEHMKYVQMFDCLKLSQQKALDELRKESEELYQAAIQIDPAFIPFTAAGPVWTPPIKDYDSPDGEYIDISKKWD